MKTFLAFVVALLLGASVHAASPVPSGLLEGRLKLAISRGVDLDTADSTKAEAPPYREYPLVVLSSDGKTEVAQFKANDQGRYRVSLLPGDYLLDVKKHGRLRVTPRPFSIVAGKTVQVDFEIHGPLNVMSRP